jgi:hypothetical protein
MGLQPAQLGILDQTSTAQPPGAEKPAPDDVLKAAHNPEGLRRPPAGK